jgi:predicted small lipoprotein YifL
MMQPVRETDLPRLSRKLPFIAVQICAVGALAIALAGCGRKGSLDPPPGASAQQPAVEEQSGQSGTVAPSGVQLDNNDGRPVAPKGQKKKLPIDWLID